MAEVLLPSPHPLTPPRSEEDWVTWYRLLRSRRVGPSTFYRLIEEHGSAETALASLPDLAAEAGVKDYFACPAAVAIEELRAGRSAGAEPIANGSPAYPERLSLLADAPPVLWTLGDAQLLKRPMIAIVGARNASSLGTRMARAMAEGLGEAGYVVVSGLARGVDTAAHEASLATGTVAVQAGGVDVVYPSENTDLANEIASQGLRVSEQPMGMQPMARHFPTRNRIVSGLAQAVVVIEAAAKSGSLITARTALDQGREVLVVPGHPFDARAAGCNALLRDGALLVRDAADVVEALRPLQLSTHAAETRVTDPARPHSATKQRRSVAETERLHQEILARLGPSPLAEDQLIRDIDAPAHAISPELIALELEGKIRRQPGGLLALS